MPVIHPALKLFRPVEGLDGRPWSHAGGPRVGESKSGLKRVKRMEPSPVDVLGRFHYFVVLFTGNSS